MANITILCTDAAGHLIPLGSLGAELQRRGHLVSLLSHQPARSFCDRFGLAFHALPDLSHKVERRTIADGFAALTRQRQTLNFLRRNLERIDISLAAGPALVQQTKPDLILSDQLTVTASTIAERLQVPHVSVSESLLWHWERDIPPFYSHGRYLNSSWARLRYQAAQLAWTRFMWPWMQRVNRQRKSWGLRPLTNVEQVFSPLAHLVQLIPELDFPRKQLPPTVHYVGALSSQRIAELIDPMVAEQHAARDVVALQDALLRTLPERSSSGTKMPTRASAARLADDFPWDKLDGRPLIYASVGTVYKPLNPVVLRAIAEACAPLDVQLVLTKGKWKHTECDPKGYLNEVPGNPLIVEFAPQLALLRQAALLVTHAGMNTVMEAISLGVPMVALPRSADQPGIAARIEHAGIGLQESFRRTQVVRLREKIQRVLAEPGFAGRTRDLQMALWRAGGVYRAADLVEQVVQTGKPVERSASSGN